jgi:hypothetical protein
MKFLYFDNNLKPFQSVWNKFLPVIALKLKIAVKIGELQLIEMDKLDFERASSRKTQRYQFDLELNEGRAIRNNKNSVIGMDFARALNEHEITKELIKTGNFKFNLSSKFVLSIFQVKPEPVLAE